MDLGFTYYGKMVLEFEATSPESLRDGCMAGWNLLSQGGLREGVAPQLVIRNRFSKYENRWVPGNFKYPPSGSGMMEAPHPFVDKEANWSALWEQLGKAQGALASAATWLDSMDRG